MPQFLLPQSNLDSIKVSLNSYPSKTWRIYDGRIVGYTDGKEAIKQSIQAMLNTTRYDYLIYSWNYGHELTGLVGMDKAYIEVLAPRLIKECLTQDDRISDTINFIFSNRGEGLLIEFQVITTEGIIKSEVNL
ncbi:DUF2634 domain-containing protein [Clostridium sediminicola]|uniref:DUF2634 domain-containing protein n=1 Tax=Clostridium sediminicola TaxID=3114879 RepID=UPI0031F1CE4A